MRSTGLRAVDVVNRAACGDRDRRDAIARLRLQVALHLGQGFDLARLLGPQEAGVRADIPSHAPGTQWESLVMAPKGEHSAKPEAFLKMIEGYFPTLPKVELNARVARPGWIPGGKEPELPPQNSEISSGV